jgi:hypothetical protein
MLDINLPGTSADQITNQSLIWGRGAISILSENAEEPVTLPYKKQSDLAYIL